VLQPEAQGAATLRLTIRHHPAHPLQAQRQTRLNRHGCFYPSTAVALPDADAQGDAPIPTDSETEQHMLEIIVAVFAMPVSRPGRPWRHRFVRIRALEHNGRGVLRQPGRRDGVDLQRLESHGAQDTVEMSGKQRIEEVSSPVIVA
jgi:hypothetical protein